MIASVLQSVADYEALRLHDVLNYDKFNYYAIIHHSTTIEGCTLTEIDTQLLLDEGITPKGKPLEHSLMVKDHYDALLFVLRAAESKTLVSSAFIQQINAKLMKGTGSVYQTVFGEIDATKGMFRKGNVSAGSSYFVNYDKVEALTTKLCNEIIAALPIADSIEKRLRLSFTAHFDLVSIHPFYDGNGRTCRLLMNYLQQYFNLPLAIVFKEDKADYYTALTASRKNEDIGIFQNFMFGQYEKFLNQQVREYKDSIDKKDGGSVFSFVF
ncbi:MAG: Fic family protein [Chitinophagaceae bacterium]